MTFLLCQSKLFLQCLQRGGLRLGIRHFEVRGNATECSRPTLTLDISLACQARFTKMNMIVNDTWQNKTPRGINYSITDTTGSFTFIYFGNLFIIYQEVALERASLVDDDAIFYQYFHAIYILLWIIFPLHSPDPVLSLE